MSATSETRSGNARGLFVAVVALLAATTLFVLWRERHDRANEVADAISDESLASTMGETTTGETTTRRARTCRGRFVFVDGEPAESVGFRVESRPEHDAPYEVVGRGLTKSDGGFSLELYENWRLGRTVRFGLSEGEQLEVDPREFDLASGVPLEVELKGARVALEYVNQRGDPRSSREIHYEYADASGVTEAESPRFGVTDRRGCARRDFRTPTTIVVWAANASGTRCSDRVAIAMQAGVRANRRTLTSLLPPGGLYVTVVDELDRPLNHARVSLSRSGRAVEPAGGSGSLYEYELLHPGEYVLVVSPPRREDEHDDLAAPQYVFTRVLVEVEDSIEDMRVPLPRAALLVLDVSRTGEWSDTWAYLRVPGEDDASVRAADAPPLPPWRDALRWARFVDATGRDRTEDATFPRKFREPGRYWCLVPPGTFEVVFFEAHDKRTRFPRGPVELTSERETTLAVEF
jgi:hypothetical protein